MSVIEAIILGVIEGLTEWLPVSSTGHLTVIQHLLGIDGAAADSYAIAIQGGAILAVLHLYRARFASFVAGVRGRDPQGRGLLVAVLVASAPAAVTGYLYAAPIKTRLFGVGPVVIAWLLGGIAILVAARRLRGLHNDAGASLHSLTWRGALVIGLAQILALWPGTSRSLVTILAGTAVGLTVPAAVEFSFLLGFVLLGGATLYETVSEGGEMVASYGLLRPALGLAVAFGASIVTMRWMVAYLNRRGLGVFGWYRIGAAVAAGALLATGIL